MQGYMLVSAPTLTELVDGLVQSRIVQRCAEKPEAMAPFQRAVNAGRCIVNSGDFCTCRVP